jgi:hypothetical protein
MPGVLRNTNTMPTIRIIHKMPTISPVYRTASSDLLLVEQVEEVVHIAVVIEDVEYLLVDTCGVGGVEGNHAIL